MRDPDAVVAPQVIAHRGASAEAPEHTLAAYQRALDLGVAGLEADIRLTADGQLVCVHDRRLERTSDGSGVLSTFTLAELQQMDFASWKVGDDDVPDVDTTDPIHQILTLERLVQLALDHARPLRLLLETKHPTRYGGYVEERLAQVLGQVGLHQPSTQQVSVTLMTFSELAIRRMRKLTPALPRVYLLERVPLLLRMGKLPDGVGTAGPSIDIVRAHPGYVSRVHDNGGQVYVWTVDDEADVHLVADLGVDAIITNRPGAVLSWLGRDAAHP